MSESARAAILSLAELAVAGAVYFCAIGSQVAPVITSFDRGVIAAIYLIAGGFLYIFGSITGHGWGKRPSYFPPLDWFLQNVIVHSDQRLASALIVVSLAALAWPQIVPLQFLIAMAVGTWMVGYAILSAKIAYSDRRCPVDPIFVKMPKRVQRLIDE